LVLITQIYHDARSTECQIYGSQSGVVKT